LSFNLSQETFHEIAKGIGLQFDQVKHPSPLITKCPSESLANVSKIPHMAGWVKEGGFDEIQVTEKMIPIGTWPKDKRLKEVGMYYLIHLLVGE
jgi:hypothetical protein